MPDEQKDEPSLMAGFGQAMGLSAELVVTTLVGLGLGWLADGWIGTRPLLSVLGALAGGAAGVNRVYRSWRRRQ